MLINNPSKRITMNIIKIKRKESVKSKDSRSHRPNVKVNDERDGENLLSLKCITLFSFHEHTCKQILHFLKTCFS